MKMPKDLRYITVNYTVYSDFDVKDVDWNDVKDYYIKYNTLYITHLDDTKTPILPYNTEYDTKRPSSEMLCDEEYNELG